ncbi:hypothetical protein LVD15_21600 [Fulvivirga maritima]|uniref:hypothetical protein n=1 Tax=Fulvivirga maritima TaxID=2904247 RepID=UPI001F3A4946|nr:hypothetical protein [Fulvivirga maritima]UII25868.1 hypothetical protein LVD15_21600 [Fulvivirga maritima]
MHELKTINLYHIPFEEIFLKIRSGFPHYEYDFKKHLIHLKDENFDRVGFVRLPLHLVINDQLRVLDELATVLYVSIESGYAAICIMEGKENDYHTTFSAYMTRKKQGFSQIKYLNKKGKSRAGSRVRLAATTEFFENINITLTDLFEDYEFDRIALNCNSTLIPYLYNAKEPCPFDKKDERLYKIPVHIPQSNYTNLDAAIKKLMAPMLFYDEEDKDMFELFI